MPNGNANGPGSEFGCKETPGSKYCHNYFQFYVPTNGTNGLKLENLRPRHPKQNLGGFNVGRESPRLVVDPSLLSRDGPYKATNKSGKFYLELDTSQLVNLYDLLAERSSYFAEVQTQLTALYEDRGLFPQRQGELTLDQVVGIWISLWLQVNFLNGVGEFGFSMVFPYQGMCFPSACTLEDIEINSRQFGIKLSTGLGWVISSPVINEGRLHF